MKLVSDNALAKTCGWTPQHSLDDGLKATIDWIRNNLDRYRPDSYAV